MINNILGVEFFYDKNKNISYVKCNNIGYEIDSCSDNITQYQNEEFESLLLLESLNGNIIKNICDFNILMTFIEYYIKSNKNISINEIMNSFNILMFKKFFVIRRQSCFSQITQLIKIQKHNDCEYRYYFRYNNERYSLIVSF